MWNSQRETSQSSLKLKQLPHPMPIQILYHVLFMLLSPTYPIMNLYGLVGHEKNENSFYFRRPKVSAGKQTLTITIKGTEQLQIHSIKIYNRPDIIIRQFENAVVCVNPSLEEQEIHLSDFITEYSEKLKIAPIDAVFIPKSKNK